MNAALMVQYIEFVATASAAGAEPIYATNPFDWADLISLQGKTNFFERRVGEYQKAGVAKRDGGHGANSFVFTTDADF